MQNAETSKPEQPRPIVSAHPSKISGGSLRASGPSTGAGQLEDRRLACPDAYPTGYSCPLTSATDSASSKALNATYLEYWLGRWRYERHGERGPAPQHGRSSVRKSHTPSAVTSRKVITRAASPTATIDGGACGEKSEDAGVSTCMLRAASPTAAINQLQ